MLIPDAPSVADMSEGLSTIPEATYNLRVHKAEYVAIPKRAESKGSYIKAQLIVTGPASAEKAIGRYVFMNYSLSGEGNFRLKELLKVTGHPDDFKLTDDQQLVGLEFGAAVIIKAGVEGNSDKNEVKKHLPLLS